MSIRNSAKAIIICGDKVLLTKNQDNGGIFIFSLAVDKNTAKQLNNALIRECIEEVGKEVEIGELFHIREYIGKNHEHSSFDFNIHQIEYYFVYSLVNEMNNYKTPTNPDSHQVGIEWIHINDLLQYRIYPK
ncbi:NUDIX domain-containing protein [Peribacillus frigoritolerans]